MSLLAFPNLILYVRGVGLELTLPAEGVKITTAPATFETIVWLNDT